MDLSQKNLAFTLTDFEIYTIADVSLQSRQFSWPTYTLHRSDGQVTLQREEIINTIRSRFPDWFEKLPANAFDEEKTWDGVRSQAEKAIASKAETDASIPENLKELKQAKEQHDANINAEAQDSGQTTRDRVLQALKTRSELEKQTEAAKPEAESPQKENKPPQPTPASTSTVGRGAPLPVAPRSLPSSEKVTQPTPSHQSLRHDTEESIERAERRAEARAARPTEGLGKFFEQSGWKGAFESTLGIGGSKNSSSQDAQTEALTSVSSPRAERTSDLIPSEKSHTSKSQLEKNPLMKAPTQGSAYIQARSSAVPPGPTSTSTQPTPGQNPINNAVGGAGRLFSSNSSSSTFQQSAGSLLTQAQIGTRKLVNFAGDNKIATTTAVLAGLAGFLPGASIFSGLTGLLIGFVGGLSLNQAVTAGGGSLTGEWSRSGVSSGEIPSSRAPKGSGMGDLIGMLGKRALLKRLGAALTGTSAGSILLWVGIVFLIVLIAFLIIKMIHYPGAFLGPPLPEPQGQARDAVFTVQKSAVPDSLPNYDGSKTTINYKITITAGKNPLTVTSIKDKTTKIKGSGETSVRDLTIDNPSSPIQPGQTFEKSYPLEISGPEFKDSVLINVITVIGKDSSGSEETQKASLAILINNPPLQQPYGFPSIGTITSLDLYSGGQTHFSCFLIFNKPNCIDGGIDIALRNGTEVYSTLDGQVMSSQWDDSVGGAIYVQSCLPGQTPPNCKGPYIAEFLHLDQQSVTQWKKDQFVSRKTLLGKTYVGKLPTTRCSNPADCHPEHVHYQITLSGGNVFFCDNSFGGAMNGLCTANTWGSCKEGKIEPFAPKLGQNIDSSAVAPACN